MPLANRCCGRPQLISDRLEELHSHSEEWQRQTAAEKQRILSKTRGAAGGQHIAPTIDTGILVRMRDIILQHQLPNSRLRQCFPQRVSTTRHAAKLVLSHRTKSTSLPIQVLASSDISKTDAGASVADGGGKQPPGLLPQPQNPSVLLPAVRGVAAMIAAE